MDIAGPDIKGIMFSTSYETQPPKQRYRNILAKKPVMCLNFSL